MARIGASIKVTRSTRYAEDFDKAGQIADTVPASTTTADLATLATDQTAFESALATLVADGASPTQAHVTAANDAYTTMQTDLAAVVADLAASPPSGAMDVVLSVDTTACPTIACLRQAVDRLVNSLAGSSYLTT